MNESFLKKPIPKDPSAETAHLNPDGTHKRHKVDRQAQDERSWQRQQDKANVIIDPKLPIVDHSDNKPIEKPWWEGD